MLCGQIQKLKLSVRRKKFVNLTKHGMMRIMSPGFKRKRQKIKRQFDFTDLKGVFEQQEKSKIL